MACSRSGEEKSLSQLCSLTNITLRSICWVLLSRKSRKPLKLHLRMVLSPQSPFTTTHLLTATPELHVPMFQKVHQVSLDPHILVFSMKQATNSELGTEQLKSLTAWFVQRYKIACFGLQCIDSSSFLNRYHNSSVRSFDMRKNVLVLRYHLSLPLSRIPFCIVLIVVCFSSPGFTRQQDD